jgi:hypothetical protein
MALVAAASEGMRGGGRRSLMCSMDFVTSCKKTKDICFTPPKPHHHHLMHLLKPSKNMPDLYITPKHTHTGASPVISQDGPSTIILNVAVAALLLLLAPPGPNPPTPTTTSPWLRDTLPYLYTNNK